MPQSWLCHHQRCWCRRCVKIIQLKMAHRSMQLTHLQGGVSIHHYLDVLVLRSEPLNTFFFEPAVGHKLAHLLELIARECLFHQVGTWVSSVAHAAVNKLVHFCLDHAVSDLVLLGHTLLHFIFPLPIIHVSSWCLSSRNSQQYSLAYKSWFAFSYAEILM